MKTWYWVECKKCKELCEVMVNNPICSAHYLGPYSRQIQEWLTKHYGCELTLGWRDDHLDDLWERGYTNKDKWFEKEDKDVYNDER